MSVHLPTVPGPGAETPPRPAVTSSGRLVTTLAVAGALAGLLIVLVHEWSQPRIEAHRARVLAEAVDRVLAAPATTLQLYLVEGRLVAEPPPAADTASLDRVWLGLDEAGRPVGVAAVASAAGFQDVIRLIFGYDPGTGTVLGMTVLESRETPGLGDKIEKDSAFVAEFRDVAAPLVGVKAGKATGAGGEVDIITGATISSQAVIDIINARLEEVGDPLARYWAGDRTGRAPTGLAPPRSGPTGPDRKSPDPARPEGGDDR